MLTYFTTKPAHSMKYAHIAPHSLFKKNFFLELTFRKSRLVSLLQSWIQLCFFSESKSEIFFFAERKEGENYNEAKYKREGIRVSIFRVNTGCVDKWRCWEFKSWVQSWTRHVAMRASVYANEQDFSAFAD